jgi:hypothetical protein
MIPNNMTRAELADFAHNAATQVAAGKVTGLLPEQAAAFSDGFELDADELEIVEAEAAALRSALMAATRRGQQLKARTLRRTQNLKYAMKAASSPASEFLAVGLAPPAARRKMIEPQTPAGLSASGYSNGVNRLRFIGNNQPNTVRYIVEARRAHAVEYEPVGVTNAQKFEHHNVVPGDQYQYRVYALTTRGRISNPSNEAVVYRL